MRVALLSVAWLIMCDPWWYDMLSIPLLLVWAFESPVGFELSGRLVFDCAY